MVSKVVSTKLNIEEHGKLLQICKDNNSTPSALIKGLILDLISNKVLVPSNETKSLNIETKPLETKPLETKPLETKPLETKPLETKPLETKPLETKPLEPFNELAKTAEDKIAFEIIKRVEEDDITYETLQGIYNKLNEKYEHGGLTKMEEMLFRKVHRHLREKVRERPEVQRLSLDERFQYF